MADQTECSTISEFERLRQNKIIKAQDGTIPSFQLAAHTRPLYRILNDGCTTQPQLDSNYVWMTWDGSWDKMGGIFRGSWIPYVNIRWKTFSARQTEAFSHDQSINSLLSDYDKQGDLANLVLQFHDFMLQNVVDNKTIVHTKAILRKYRLTLISRARGSVVVEALCYKPEGRGFDSR
jgi:hypothetical protein